MNEEVIDKIATDLYNKKITVYTESSKLVLKCSTINEFIDLLNECKKLLKTDNIKYR